MSSFAACLLDYGNTVVQFDRPQIDHVLTRLAAAWGEFFEPVRISALRRSVEQVVSRPHVGNPPTFREHRPDEQMGLIVEGLLGAAAAEDKAVIVTLNERLQDAFVECLELAPEDGECLRSLSARLPLGLVSNYPCGQTIRRSLRVLGIEDCFPTCVVSGDLGRVKPHASVFEAALEQLDCAPDRVLFVGDRWDADMVGARDVGMKTCHILGHTRDHNLEERYRQYLPDYRIARLRDLDEIL